MRRPSIWPRPRVSPVHPTHPEWKKDLNARLAADPILTGEALEEYKRRNGEAYGAATALTEEELLKELGPLPSAPPRRSYSSAYADYRAAGAIPVELVPDGRTGPKLVCPCRNTVFSISVEGVFVCTNCQATGSLSRTGDICWTVPKEVYDHSV